MVGQRGRARIPAASADHAAEHAFARPDGHGARQPAEQSRGARADANKSRRCGRARNSRRRRGPGFQRSRRDSGRRSSDRRHSPRRDPNLDRRVVRPARTGRDRQSRQARQSERAHARQGNLAPRARPERSDHTGPGREVHRRAAAGDCLQTTARLNPPRRTSLRSRPCTSATTPS